MELNPQVVFERLFGKRRHSGSAKCRMKQSRSILDSLLDELQGLKKNLGVPISEPSTNTRRKFARSSGESRLAAKASSQVSIGRRAIWYS